MKGFIKAYIFFLVLALSFASSASSVQSSATPIDSSLQPKDILQQKDSPHHKTYRVALIKGDFIAKSNFEEIEKKLGLNFTYQIFQSFPDVVQKITSGEYDFAANMIYNEERAKLFQISSPTNLVYMYYFSKKAKFEDAKSITTANRAYFINSIRQLYPDTELKLYSNFEEGLALVENGEVDGIVDSIANMELFLNKGYNLELFNDFIPLEPAGLVASFNVDKTLLNEMAKALQTTQYQKDLRLLVEEHQLALRKHYIKSISEQLDVDLIQPINIKLENLYAFSEYMENGEVQGFAGDILSEVCDVLEANCQITSTADESWDSMFNDLKNNKIDLLGPIAISEARKKLFHFSNSYYNPNIVVVKRNNYKNNAYEKLSELIIENVGVVKDDYFQSILIKALPQKEIIKFTDVEEEIDGLVKGKVDYILLTSIDYNLAMVRSKHKLPIQIDENFSIKVTAEVAFAFPMTERGKNLQILFDHGLSLIDTNKIVNQYDESPNWSLILQTQRQTEAIIYLFFIFLFLIITLFLCYQYRRSHIDELTKLNNRRALYSKHGKGLKKGVYLIYLDLNDFKSLNDTYGHKTGDNVLIAFAKKIKQNWSADSYRIGGDEFIVIGQCRTKELERFINKISTLTIVIEGKELEVKSSIGEFHVSDKLVALDEAMHQADISMYEHKKTLYEQGNERRDRRE